MDEAAASRIPERDEDRVVAPNFVTAVVDEDLRSGRVRTVVTRFPPEPNGYLHIGHAKAICLDFGVAQDYGGRTNLRFDDTNPTTEDPEYVAAIERDVRWLGFAWHEERYASDYFGQLFDLACRLIERGDAYVDSQPMEAIREGRGTVTTPGTPSPYRERPAEESLELFRRMRDGAFEEGAHVLRAKIDMASPNMIMRDPVLYRIRHAHHYRTGDAWHVYPMYDFAHPLSDAIEGVTHSLCTLEFENNREIYDWLVERLFPEPRPRQYEFARLNLDHTVVSKRKLLKLVQGGYVSGWDDPRMPTLTALRRRGVTPAAIRDFANRVGVTKTNARTDVGVLESAVRDDLNHRAPRAMAVLDPIPLTLSDLPDGPATSHDAPLWPHDVPREGSRPLPFSREAWIERGDVAVDPPKGWRRLAPGAAVRLRHGPAIVCEDIEVDADGRPTAVRARTVADPESEGVKVRGVLHWVERGHAVPAEFRLFDRLFAEPDPEAGGRDVTEAVDPASRVVRRGWVEPYVADADPDTRWQFERQGYFWRDPVDGRGDALVFNRIVTLKDGWSRKTRAADAGTEAGTDATSEAGTDATSEAASAPTRRPPAGRAGNEPDPVEALDRAGRERFDVLEAAGVARLDAARLAADPATTAWFEAARAAPADAEPAALASWLVNEVPRALAGAELTEARLTPEAFAELVALVGHEQVSATVAKELLVELAAQGGDPATMVEERGLRRLDDAAALAATVERILDAHPDEVAAYLGGKEGLIGFFIGQAMRATGGRADAKAVRDALAAALDARR
jgi:glutaminyl-tRNA synthetase